MTMRKWAGIIGFEGQKTGDGRIIKPGALTWDDEAFPKPFRWAVEDHGAHDGATVIGTLEGVDRLEAVDDSTPLRGWGYIDTESVRGQEACAQIVKGMTTGVSMDLDSIAFEVSEPEAMSGMTDGEMSIGGARMRAVTLVALPAFERARIELVEAWPHETGETEMSLEQLVDAVFATIDPRGNWHDPKTGKFIDKPWDLLAQLEKLSPDGDFEALKPDVEALRQAETEDEVVHASSNLLSNAYRTRTELSSEAPNRDKTLDTLERLERTAEALQDNPAILVGDGGFDEPYRAPRKKPSGSRKAYTSEAGSKDPAAWWQSKGFNPVDMNPEQAKTIFDAVTSRYEVDDRALMDAIASSYGYRNNKGYATLNAKLLHDKLAKLGVHNLSLRQLLQFAGRQFVPAVSRRKARQMTQLAAQALRMKAIRHGATFAGMGTSVRIDAGGQWGATFPRKGYKWIDNPMGALHRLKDLLDPNAFASLEAEIAQLDTPEHDAGRAQDAVRATIGDGEMDGGIGEATQDDQANALEDLRDFTDLDPFAVDQAIDEFQATYPGQSVLTRGGTSPAETPESSSMLDDQGEYVGPPAESLPNVPNWTKDTDSDAGMPYYTRESTGADDLPGTHDVIAPHESGEGWGFPDWKDGPSFATPQEAADYREQEIAEDKAEMPSAEDQARDDEVTKMIQKRQQRENKNHRELAKESLGEGWEEHAEPNKAVTWTKDGYEAWFYETPNGTVAHVRKIGADSRDYKRLDPAEVNDYVQGRLSREMGPDGPGVEGDAISIIEDGLSELSEDEYNAIEGWRIQEMLDQDNVQGAVDAAHESGFEYVSEQLIEAGWPYSKNMTPNVSKTSAASEVETPKLLPRELMEVEDLLEEVSNDEFIGPSVSGELGSILRPLFDEDVWNEVDGGKGKARVARDLDEWLKTYNDRIGYEKQEQLGDLSKSLGGRGRVSDQGMRTPSGRVIPEDLTIALDHFGEDTGKWLENDTGSALSSDGTPDYSADLIRQVTQLAYDMYGDAGHTEIDWEVASVKVGPNGDTITPNVGWDPQTGMQTEPGGYWLTDRSGEVTIRVDSIDDAERLAQTSPETWDAPGSLKAGVDQASVTSRLTPEQAEMAGRELQGIVAEVNAERSEMEAPRLPRSLSAAAARRAAAAAAEGDLEPLATFMDELIRYQHSFPRFASDWLNSLKTKLPELKELVEAKGTRYDSNRPETSLAASDAPGASQSSTDVAKAGGDAKAIRAALREEHPDWDSRRVATVASKMEKDNRASAASSAVEAAEASTPAASEAPTKRAKPDSLKRLEKQIREGANPKNLWSWVRDNPDAPEELKDLVVQARNNDTRPTPADNSAAARRDDKLVRDTVNAYYSPKAAAVDTSAVNQTTGPGVEFDALKNADETGALAELELPEGWTVSVHRKSGWPDRYGLTDESGVDVAYSKSDGRWYPTSSEINPLDLPNNDEGVDADDLNSRIQSSTAAVDAPAETGYFSDLPSGTLETVPDLESPAIAEHSSDLAGYRRISGTEINSLRGEDEFFSRPPLMYGEGTFLVGPEGTVIESTTYNLPDGSKKPGFRVRFQRDGDTFELAMSPEELELSKDQQLKLAKGLALQKAIELREGNSASAPDATNASDEPDAPTADASSVDPVAAHQAAMGEVDTEQRSLDQLKDELRGLQSRNAPQSTIDSMLKTIEERQAKLNDLIEQENAAAAVRREFDEEQWQERVAGLDKAGLLKEYRNLDEDRVRQQNARTPDRAKERQIEARMRQVNDLLNSVSGANGQGVSDAPASGSGSAVEMLRKGADGKAVRDQLRQENPGATNRQIWAIYNAMVKRNEGTLSVDSTQKLITVTPGQWARKGKATMAAKRRVVLAGGGSDQFVRKGDLDRSPKSNWVEEQGGLPEYIGEVADALHRKGMNISRAIATAVNTIKRWARGGPAAQGQKGSVSKATQAKAIKALAEWETKRAAARASRLEAGMTFATIDVHGNWHHPHTGEYIHKPWDLDLDLKNLLTPEERAELSVSAGMDASAVHNALYNLRKTFRTMKGGVTPQQMDVAWGQIATLRDAWSLGALKREDGKPWSEEAIAAFEKVDQMIDRAEASLEYMETQFLESEIGFDNPVDDQVPDETPEIDLDAPTAELRRLLSAGLTAREVAMIQEELQTRRTDESQVESLINVKRAEIEAERAFPQDPGLPRGLRVEDRELIQQAVASHLGEIDLDKPGTIVPVNDKTFTDRWIVTNEAGVKGYVEHDGPNRIVFTPFDATASDPLVHLGRQEPAVIADRILNGDFDYDPETGQLLEAGEPVLTLDEKKRGRVNGVLAKSPGFVPAQAELEHRPVHEGFPDSGEAYDASQWRDDIKDGDTLVTQDGKVAVLVKAWPIAVTEDNGHFHKLLVPLREFLAQPENAEYAGAFADAIEEAKSRGLVTITLDSEPTASTELPSRNGGYHEDNEPGMYREPGWDEEWAVNRAVLASGAKNELAAPIKPPAEWFANPNLTEATPLTITKDGRVFGHVATWGVCHTASMGNDCVMVPSSKTDYAMFHLGVVETAEGTEVPVGRITMRTGHASEYANARKALAHYENTGQAVADVHAGEDAFGVWIAGALRPDVTPEQLRALKSSPLSGDWRYLASTGSLEMLMVLAVNMPGFPVPRPKGLVASGALRSLTSAGMVAPKKVPAEKVQAAMAGDTLAADDIRYLQKLARQAKQAEAEALKLQVAKVTMLPGISEMAQRLAAERRVREMAASLRKKERI